MKRSIFVGSSSEGFKLADIVGEILSKDHDFEVVMWPSIFNPGSVTFESLEKMLVKCCAAVFVATPDDTGTIRGRQVSMPRANVMLEFGLVAGRLGRSNIAICAFGETELPSDLQGLTLVKMDADPASEKRKKGEEQLQRWCSGLLPTAELLPRTEIVHGYTGQWDFELRLDTWRSIPVGHPNYAEVNGSMDLFITATGESGTGIVHGQLAFEIATEAHALKKATTSVGAVTGLDAISHTDPPSWAGHHRKPYSGELQVVHRLSEVQCLPNGGLRLSSRTFSIHPVHTSGHPLEELSGLFGRPEPWTFEWALEATGGARVLEGTFRTLAGGTTAGKVRAVKRNYS